MTRLDPAGRVSLVIGTETMDICKPVSLCPTCAVEHATDDNFVECSKMGRHGLPVGSCSKHTKTREKQLEDLLRNLVAAWDDETPEVWPGNVNDVVDAARKLIGKASR